MSKLQGIGGQDKPIVVRAADITALNRGLGDRLLWGTKDTLAYYSSIDTMVADVMGLADSCEYSINIGKDLWLTLSRWNTLIRQYIDPERLFKFLEGVKDISTYKRGIVAMDTNIVKPTVVASNPRANRRKHGACIRMLTYRAFPRPTLSMYSRTSYLGYIGALDLLLANRIAAMACDMIGEGLQLKDMAFRWHIEVAQFHGFKSLAHVFYTKQDKLLIGWPNHGINGKQPEDYPTWKIVRSWYQRIQRLDAEGKKYSDMKYGAEIRIRRRLHAMRKIDDFTDKKFKPSRLANIPAELVTLDSMLYKSPESRAIIRRKKKARAEQLVTELFADGELMNLVSDGLEVEGLVAADE
jgi:hypothetical protein